MSSVHPHQFLTPPPKRAARTRKTQQNEKFIYEEKSNAKIAQKHTTSADGCVFSAAHHHGPVKGEDKSNLFLFLNI